RRRAGPATRTLAKRTRGAPSFALRPEPRSLAQSPEPLPMFQHFFHALRAAKVPVTLKEYLTLLEAMDKGVLSESGGSDVQDFYYLARSALVKDEKHLDRFDKVFGHVFKGLDSFEEGVDVHQFPEEWLRKLSEKYLTEEEKKQIESMGGWDKLMETLKQRMAEQ